MKRVTLCFLVRGDEVLLAMKLRGFGKGRWNGIGGKLTDKETFEEATRREAFEEIGVGLGEIEWRGTLRFHTIDSVYAQEFDQICEVFVAEKWDGEPRRSEEMDPKWFKFDAIPFESMWPDDPFWLPKVLAGKRVDCEFLFDKDDRILEKRISVV